jgi:minor extracellular serine protease Vpr
MKSALSSLILLAFTAFGQTPSRLVDYALVLEDPPAARKAQSRMALQGAEAQAHLQKIRKAQSGVLAELARRKVRVRSSTQVLVNAVFVSATRETAAQLKDIPGVVYVQYLPPVKRDLNTALSLENVQAAWSAVGGASNAGAGIKIGIIDSGIDQNHPGFQDSSLTPPPGFPKGDANYTNNKVIVARSYVSTLNNSDPHFSSPDDVTPRDRVGHGTAIAMIAAGAQNTGPAGTIQGVAPKAFLGNYKIFGSPGVNDGTLFGTPSAPLAVIQALTDAVNDGMDIVTLSINEGDPAFDGPLDFDSDPGFCGGPCDVRVQAVESAVALGLVVVASAGNAGNIGILPVTLSSVLTPGTAPSAITVGASTNSHTLFQAVRVNVAGVLSNLNSIHALFGDGPHIAAPLTATIRDVASLQNDGLACSTLPAGSLIGAIALIQRGTCFFSDKINHAQAAGAVGVIIYQPSGTDSIFSGLGAQNTGIPAVMIGNTDGNALKSFLASNSGVTASMDPVFAAVDSPASTVAPYSSRGPSIGLFGNGVNTPTERRPVVLALKPELVAVGDNLYTATQKLDPNGDVYNASGYAMVSGTSFAVPMVAGAVALVKQKYSANKLTPAQLKSAVVNSASQDVSDGAAVARVNAVGAGKLKVDDAVTVAAVMEPATLAFGVISTTTVSSSLNLKVTNVSGAPATFNFAVNQRDPDSKATVKVSLPSLILQAGGSNSISVSLSGSRPNPGSYEGFIEVTGMGPKLRVPYLYLVGSGAVADIMRIHNASFAAPENDTGYGMFLRAMDQYGVPVLGYPVQFNVVKGGGTIVSGDNQTFLYGEAGALMNLGPAGDQIFTATLPGFAPVEFDGFARALPAINDGGVVNAAPFQAGQGLAPGSYISIFGTLLSDANAIVTTPSLPVSLASVSVSFDGGGLSLPGHLHFVSPGQVNVQIPWEFQGQSSVQMKVTAGSALWSKLYTVPLAIYSPGVFAITDVPGAVISQSNPAKRGQPIIVYANGLGPVDQPVTSGDPSPPAPSLANTRVTPTVTIGASTAQVLFSGLTPGSVGLYQLNVVVPADAQTGSQQMKISIGGVDLLVNLQVQ